MGGSSSADRGSGPHEKSYVVIGFLRNSNKDHHREAIGLSGPIASQGRSVQPSVKYVDDKKTLSGAS